MSLRGPSRQPPDRRERATAHIFKLGDYPFFASFILPCLDRSWMWASVHLPPTPSAPSWGRAAPRYCHTSSAREGSAGFVGDPTPALSRGSPKGARRTVGHDVFGVFDSPTGLSRRASWTTARNLQVDRVIPADPDAVSKPPQNKEARVRRLCFARGAAVSPARSITVISDNAG